MEIYLKIAKVLDEMVSFERESQKAKAKLKAKILDYPDPIPCEGCKTLVFGGGLCPGCLELAAGACRWKGKKG